MGTAELACASLQALAADPNLKVVAVVTQPDRPQGRELKLTPSPVKNTALSLQLPILQPERLRNPDAIKQLADLQPDLIVVAAYGQILSQTVLELPRHGCLNVHGSLLPRHRGAAPIQWAMLEGDAQTGITIMKMDAGLDTGAMLSTAATPIGPDDTAQTLHDRLAAMGAQLLLKTIPPYVQGSLLPQPQDDSKATYARKIKKEDGLIDWRLPAAQIALRLRAFTPWPGCYSYLEIGGKALQVRVGKAEACSGSSGQPGNVVEAQPEGIMVACGEGILRILELQRQGKRMLKASEFLAGTPLKPGLCFSQSPQ